MKDDKDNAAGSKNTPAPSTEEPVKHQNPFSPEAHEPVSEEEITKEQEYKEALTERD